MRFLTLHQKYKRVLYVTSFEINRGVVSRIWVLGINDDIGSNHQTPSKYYAKHIFEPDQENLIKNAVGRIS